MRESLREFGAGVYNRTPGKAGRLMKSLGVEAREYASEDELFDDDRVNIVVSCTPPDVRPRHIERAAKSGRHVVIEKPIVLTGLSGRWLNPLVRRDLI